MRLEKQRRPMVRADFQSICMTASLMKMVTAPHTSAELRSAQKGNCRELLSNTCWSSLGSFCFPRPAQLSAYTPVSYAAYVYAGNT